MSEKYAPYKKPQPAILSFALESLSNFHPMSTELRNEFTEKSFEFNLNKNEYLLTQGEISNYLYFLVSGTVTGYRIKGNKKITTFICGGGNFVSAIEGMYGLTPSEDSIVAADNCLLLGLRSADLLYFFEAYPEMNVVMRKLLETYYRDAHERSVIVRMGTAMEKYDHYLKSLPTTYTGHVPVAVIASYLDIKTATLERLIKKREKNKIEPTEDYTIKLLEEAMTSEKLFQQKRLTLKAMAISLGIGAHELSAILNTSYNQSFTAYINTHRVTFVQERIKTKDILQQLTIEALGEEAGFSSKSTFFATFKKITGQSPLEFVRTAADPYVE